MDLQGFDIDNCAIVAPPGIRLIEYTPIDGTDSPSEEIEHAIDGNYNLNYTLSFEGGQWFTLPIAFGSAEWREDVQDNPQGHYANISVNSLIPGDSPSIRAELGRMKQHRFLLRLTARDGLKYLVGSPEYPLQFESRFDSGSDGGDTRGHRCAFSGVRRILSPKYAPVF